MADIDKLHDLCREKTYKDQAIWFLNCFWADHGDEKELLWDYVQKCNELDDQKHEQGTGLDEMKAHVFLEAFNETLTVREMRNRLRNTGAIGEKERPKAVPLTHYLLFKYGVDWHTLVDETRQGGNEEALAEAQRRLDEVMNAFKESEAAAAAAAEALRIAKADEAAAKEREAEALQAQRELEAALAELKAQEDAYAAKTEALKKKSEEGGVVSRNKAKNELAQHLAEDPLPLRKAKITQEAAVKRAERATAAAAAAREQAEASARESEEKKQAAEAAVEECRQKVAEAEAYLEEVKRMPGQAEGAIWWMERQLHEQKKYLPESKGGIRR